MPKPRARRRPPADVVLAATLHDERGALADDVRRFLPRLQALYRAVVVATSPPTAPRITRLLADAGAHAGAPPSNRRGPLYRLALRAALASGAPRVHYLDFDRALHWLRRAPRELAAVLRVAPRQQALVVGRTAKAHRSHHLPLYATETLVNRLLAARLGLAHVLDLLVPSFVLTADGTARLVAASRARDDDFYGELAALLTRLEPELASLDCRGLDWETPDRHRRAVRRTGLAAWRRRQATPAEWELRIRMAAAILAGATRTLARRPGPAPRLLRVPPRLG